MDEKESILIVDDDESTCRTLALILGKKGYETEAAGTGQEAIEKAQGRFFNLALIDLRLPDKEGVELLAPFKEMHPDMAVIMFTAFASLETAVWALNEGASAYITKPLNMDEVLATVRKVFEKQRLVREKYQAEEELRKSLEELKRSNRELNEYTYLVAHDLRTPLRSTTSFSEFLLNEYSDKLDETGRDYLKRIINASMRMAELIRDLLVFSKITEEDEQEELVDLNNLLDEVKRGLEARLMEKRVEIQVEKLPDVKAPLSKIRQLFKELISNGLKFNDSTTPKVEVGYEEHLSHHVFRVRDNGIGIREEDQKRIFNLFQRLHTQEEYSGIGAGLAKCRRIVESMGGRIWVDSHPGTGSTFYFTYPKEKTEES